LETVLRYLYGLDHDHDHFLESEVIAQTLHKVRVIITANKYGLDRKFNGKVERDLDKLVTKLEDPREIMNVLEACTVRSAIHALMGFVVEDILRLHMAKLVDLSDWYDWSHSVPSVNRKISEESAQMKLLQWDPVVLCCDGCGEAVPARPNRHRLGCECGDGEWSEFSIRSLLP